jgi:hypothetical protein
MGILDEEEMRTDVFIDALRAENAKLHAEVTLLKVELTAFKPMKEKLEGAYLKNGEQAKAIRNVQRALERNENREINMGEAWALIKEAVGVTGKPICDCGEPGCYKFYDHRK